MSADHYLKSNHDRLKQPSWFIIAILVTITLAAFYRVYECDFVKYDDDEYVTRNTIVKNGFRAENLYRMMTSFEASNWHPLTWISLTTDYQLFGLKPVAFHLVNLAFHLANVLLLFLLLNQMTRQPWRSGLVAALFAVHPLHVESVAWVAERKDVLSTFFWLLVMIAYQWYARRPNPSRYTLLTGLFLLGLMSKPMLVTLPCVLLLMDYWPLHRLERRRPKSLAASIPVEKSQISSRITTKPDPAPLRLFPKTSWQMAILEKAPLLALSLGSCLFTILAQKAAVSYAADNMLLLSSFTRYANIIIAYATYLVMMLNPANLCCYYPYQCEPRPLITVLSALLLVAISLLGWDFAKKNPALLVGWLWYLGTLVPVIGFIKVGDHAVADRYTYIPLIGIFIALAWSVPQGFEKKPFNIAGGGIIASVLLVLVIRCQQQVLTWRNTDTLFLHAYEVSQKNWRAAYFVAEGLREKNKFDRATTYYLETSELLDHDGYFQGICGERLALMGKFPEAAKCFTTAVKRDPNSAVFRGRLGLMLARLRQLDAAKEHLVVAIQLDPNHAMNHSNYGSVLMGLGDWDLAEAEFREALRLDPDLRSAQQNLDMLANRKKK